MIVALDEVGPADRSARSSRPLRIALCQPELRPLLQALRGTSADAPYIQQASIVRGLQARGHAVTCLGPSGLREVERATASLEVETVQRTWSAWRSFEFASRAAWRGQRWLGVPYLNIFSNYRRLDAYLQALPGHEIVHERYGLYSVGLAMACRRLGLPFVLFFDADQIAEQDFVGTPITGILRWRAEQLLRFNLRTARCIICVSEPARESLIWSRRVPAEKIVIFPNAVDVNRFQPSAEARSEVRVDLGLGERPVAIFVGNFYQWHDVATLLEAFARVLTAHADAVLLLVGDGPGREDMTRRAADLGITQAVRFTGAIAHDSVPRFVAAADVAVAPAPRMVRDSWLSPMKVFEYMASGTAVVGSRVGQVGTVLEDGRNGLLVQPGDPAMLAEALSRVIADPSLRVRLGAQARADAVERHSWERYVGRLERLYAAVLAGTSVAEI